MSAIMTDSSPSDIPDVGRYTSEDQVHPVKPSRDEDPTVEMFPVRGSPEVHINDDHPVVVVGPISAPKPNDPPSDVPDVKRHSREDEATTFATQENSIPMCEPSGRPPESTQVSQEHFRVAKIEHKTVIPSCEPSHGCSDEDTSTAEVVVPICRAANPCLASEADSRCFQRYCSSELASTASDSRPRPDRYPTGTHPIPSSCEMLIGTHPVLTPSDVPTRAFQGPPTNEVLNGSRPVVDPFPTSVKLTGVHPVFRYPVPASNRNPSSDEAFANINRNSSGAESVLECDRISSGNEAIPKCDRPRRSPQTQRESIWC